MFVYYLDGCLTPYWKLFVLGLWLISLLFIFIQLRHLLRARMVERSLQEAGITGQAYEQMKPKPRRNLQRLMLGIVLSGAILIGYTSFFSTFKCTADSFLYIAPHYGPGPA